MDQTLLFSELDKEIWINLNGEIQRPSEAKISIFDRGFLFGDSIYEVLYGLNHSLIFFDEHLERLYNSAALIHLEIFLSKDEIIEEILKTLKHAKIKDPYVRIMLTRGETQLSLDPNLSFKNNLIIFVAPKPIHPKLFYVNGIKLHLATTLRTPIKSVNPNAKSGNYLNNVLALKEAKNVGADDALMLNAKGELTEGTNFNIWIVKNNVFYTPPIKSGLLIGITRQNLLKILKKNKISYEEKVLFESDIIEADEVFITSSTRGIMPVSSLDKVNYGNSIQSWPNIEKVTSLYKQLIESEKSQGIKFNI